MSINFVHGFGAWHVAALQMLLIYVACCAKHLLSYSVGLTHV